MSTHIATQVLFDSPFDAQERGSQTAAQPRLRLVSAEQATNSINVPWISQSEFAATSRIGKGGAFALALLAHVVAIAVLANMRSQSADAPLQPAEVVIVAEDRALLEIPKPPQPKLEIPQFEVPLVPIVIDTVDPNNNAITAAQRPVDQPAASVADTGTPKEVSSVEYVREPAAKYPSAARALKQRGVVMLRALVDVDGRVREVQVYRTSGYKLLDDAARGAVLNALFKPYTENGRSIPVYVRVPIEFGA